MKAEKCVYYQLTAVFVRLHGIFKRFSRITWVVTRPDPERAHPGTRKIEILSIYFPAMYDGIS